MMTWWWRPSGELTCCVGIDSGLAFGGFISWGALIGSSSPVARSSSSSNHILTSLRFWFVSVIDHSAHTPLLPFFSIRDLQGSHRLFAVFTDSGAVLTASYTLLDSPFQQYSSPLPSPDVIPGVQGKSVISIAFGWSPFSRPTFLWDHLILWHRVSVLWLSGFNSKYKFSINNFLSFFKILIYLAIN